MSQSEFRVVYSSDGENTCPTCEKRVRKCTCAETQKGGAEGFSGALTARRETKGRKGSGVIVVSGFQGLSESEKKKICSALKKKCGSGGSVKGNTIEIQGDNRDMIITVLESRGMKVKWVGG